MTSETSNDNNSIGLPSVDADKPDPHGHAAMLLVESLIHGLIARSVIGVDDAIEIVSTAADVMAEISVARGASPEEVQKSIGSLDAIASSLNYDLPKD